MVTFGDLRSQIAARQQDISQSRQLILQRRAEIAAARAEGRDILTELRKPEPKIRTQQFIRRDEPGLFAQERRLKKQRLLRVEAKQRGVVQVETQLGDIAKAEQELTTVEKQLLSQEQQLEQQGIQISKLSQDPDIQIRETNGSFEFFKIVTTQVAVPAPTARVYSGTISYVDKTGKVQRVGTKTTFFAETVADIERRGGTVIGTSGFGRGVVTAPGVPQRIVTSETKKVVGQALFPALKEPEIPKPSETQLKLKGTLIKELAREKKLTPGLFATILAPTTRVVLKEPKFVTKVVKTPEQIAFEREREEIRRRITVGSPIERIAEIGKFVSSVFIKPESFLRVTGQALFGGPEKGERILDILTQRELAFKGKPPQELFVKSFIEPGGFGQLAVIGAGFVVGFGAIAAAGTKAAGTITGSVLTGFAKTAPLIAGTTISGLVGAEVGLTLGLEKKGELPPGTGAEIAFTRLGQFAFIGGFGALAAGPPVKFIPEKVSKIVAFKAQQFAVKRGIIEAGPPLGFRIRFRISKITGRGLFRPREITDIYGEAPSGIPREFTMPSGRPSRVVPRRIFVGERRDSALLEMGRIPVRVTPEGKVVEVGFRQPRLEIGRIPIRGERITELGIRLPRLETGKLPIIGERIFDIGIKPPPRLATGRIPIRGERLIDIGIRIPTLETGKLPARLGPELQLFDIGKLGFVTITTKPFFTTAQPIIQPVQPTKVEVAPLQQIIKIQPTRFRLEPKPISLKELIRLEQLEEGLGGISAFFVDVRPGIKKIQKVDVGLGQIPLIETQQIQTLQQFQRQIQPQKLERVLQPLTIQKQITIPTVIDLTLPTVGIAEKELTKSIQIQLQGQLQSQLLLQQQIQQTIAVPQQIIKPPTRPPARVIPKQPTFFGLIGFPVVTQAVIEEERPPGFNVLVKERFIVRGKKVRPERFVKMNTRPLSRSDALSLGGFLTDNSAARSFRIMKTDKKAQSPRFSLPGFAEFKFRMKGNILIEKTAYAIDTQGEFDEIPARAVLSRLRKEQPSRRPRRERELAVMEMPVIDLFADMNKQLRRMGFGF